MDILILRRTNQNLDLIESYLAKRGFKVNSLTQLPEAVRWIMEKKPSYSLLAADLLPLKCRWLYGILNQLSPIILFSDRVNAKSLSISRELEDAYFLEPPLTSSGFEQMLRKIERDQKRPVDTVLSDTQVWIMSTLSDLALKSICAPKASREKLNSKRQVTCFHVHSPKLSGYFVISYGEGHALDGEWTQELQNQLKSLLSNFEPDTSFGQHQNIEVELVDLTKWNKIPADFIHEAKYEKNKLVLAFFKNSDPVEFSSSTHPDHLAMDLRHLAGDRPVDFDVYIYLPQNARFVLYTPKGGIFYESQKRKLSSDGVQKVHIHKRSVDEIRRYQARRFVEQSATA